MNERDKRRNRLAWDCGFPQRLREGLEGGMQLPQGDLNIGKMCGSEIEQIAVLRLSAPGDAFGKGLGSQVQVAHILRMLAQVKGDDRF